MPEKLKNAVIKPNVKTHTILVVILFKMFETTDVTPSQGVKIFFKNHHSCFVTLLCRSIKENYL